MTVKLIQHTGECVHEDDPRIPFRLELVMRPPEFMHLAWVFLCGGTENVVARASSHEELDSWMRDRGLADHPRLIRWTITGPDGSTVAQRS